MFTIKIYVYHHFITWIRQRYESSQFSVQNSDIFSSAKEDWSIEWNAARRRSSAPLLTESYEECPIATGGIFCLECRDGRTIASMCTIIIIIIGIGKLAKPTYLAPGAYRVLTFCGQFYAVPSPLQQMMCTHCVFSFRLLCLCKCSVEDCRKTVRNVCDHIKFI